METDSPEGCSKLESQDYGTEPANVEENTWQTPVLTSINIISEAGGTCNY